MSSLRNRSIVLQSLILLAFVARSFIPAGFMPGKVASSTLFPLVICSSAGSSTIYVSADKVPGAPAPEKPLHHGGDAGTRGSCAFSTSFSTGVPVVLEHLPAVVTLPSAPEPLLAFGLEDLSQHSYLSQGPPALLLHA